MLSEIVAALPFSVRETRFLKPPPTTYGVYQIDESHYGCDRHLGLCRQDITFFMVEYAPDDAAEAALESELARHGIPYDKQARMWIESEKMYETIYNFTIYKKTEVKHHG